MALNPKRPEPLWAAPNISGPMSEEQYHELERLSPDRKYEYINGRVYMMSGGTVGHDAITYNVRSSLRSQLRVRSASCNVFGENVQVLVGAKKSGKKHFLYPDATISCNPADSRLENTLIDEPKLVVEVLSPGTEAKDRGIKFRAYQRCPTIQEIVLINQFAQRVEVWQCSAEDAILWHYRQYGPGESVEFASIDVCAEIDRLYEGLDFNLTMQVLEDDEE
ncbi:MAG: Uma2 family endonuclease [Ktedonobacteraceae bacterium]